MKIISSDDSSLEKSSTKLQKEYFMCEDIIMNHYQTFRESSDFQQLVNGIIHSYKEYLGKTIKYAVLKEGEAFKYTQELEFDGFNYSSEEEEFKRRESKTYVLPPAYGRMSVDIYQSGDDESSG